MLVVELGSTFEQTGVQVEDAGQILAMWMTWGARRIRLGMLLTLQGRPHAQVDDGAVATFDDMPQLASSNHRRR